MPSATYSASIRVRPRADGTAAHDVRYRMAGKSHSLSFEDPVKAEKWANLVRRLGPTEALRIAKVSLDATAPTVSEYATAYINGKSGVEPKTLDHYRTFMRMHIGPALGHLPIDVVTRDDISAWVNSQAEAGYSGKSIENRHGFLSALMQQAVDDDVIPKNPCSKTKLPQTLRTEMVFLSADDFTQILGYIPDRYQPLVLLLAATGMRWGEATALQPTDFDLEARTVRISKSWKSSSGRGWYIGPPKTTRSRRTLRISDDLIAILRPLIESGSEWVFTNRIGAPVRQQKFWEGAWVPARRLANGLPAFEATGSEREWVARSRGTWAGRKPSTSPIGKVPRVHDLRHSYVAWQLGAGVGIDVVSRNLGHESIQTTIDIYGHIARERFDHAADTITAVLSGAMPQIAE